MALTKCSWNFGSSAVSIFSMSRDGLLDLAAVAAVEKRHARTGAGGIADAGDASRAGSPG
jgi:hypothetical protein